MIILTFVFGAFQKKAPAAESAAKSAANAASAGSAASEGTSEAIAASETSAPSISAADEKLYAYTDGQMLPITEVKDATFAQKILGEGFAILPETGEVHAPVNGTIASVFDTKHAICIVSEAGQEILIHIGLDTVNLQGKYFTAHVASGDAIKAGQLLVSFELNKIKAAGYDTVIPMVFTDVDNQPDMSGLNIRHVKQGEMI